MKMRRLTGKLCVKKISLRLKWTLSGVAVLGLIMVAGRRTLSTGSNVLRFPAIGVMQAGRDLLNLPAGNNENPVPLQSEWITGLSSQGFLSVNNILKDPKTTQEPNHNHIENNDFQVKNHYQDILDTSDFEDSIEFENGGDNEESDIHEKRGIVRESENFLDERNYFSRSDLNPSLSVDKTKSLLIDSKLKIKNDSLNPPKKILDENAGNAVPRIKSDIALARGEQNSPDFKHVMHYNHHFVPHITKDIYKPGYLVSNHQLCDSPINQTNLTDRSLVVLVILVISAPGHTAERQGIRKGWGRHKHREDVVFAFLIGLPGTDKELESLVQENQEYGDIIINKNEDVYENLSLKSLSGLDWFKQFCSHARFLLKVDDDMYVQVDRLIRLLKSKKQNDRLILGNISRGWKPVRNPKSKYFITPQQYSEDVYPDFATGPSYVISGNTVSSLFSSSMEKNYLHLEDVFVTGVLGELNTVQRIHVQEFKNNAVRIPVRFMGCTIMHTITIHKVLPEEQEEFEEMASHPVCGAKNPVRI